MKKFLIVSNILLTSANVLAIYPIDETNNRNKQNSELVLTDNQQNNKVTETVLYTLNQEEKTQIATSAVETSPTSTYVEFSNPASNLELDDWDFIETNKTDPDKTISSEVEPSNADSDLESDKYFFVEENKIDSDSDKNTLYDNEELEKSFISKNNFQELENSIIRYKVNSTTFKDTTNTNTPFFLRLFQKLKTPNVYEDSARKVISSPSEKDNKTKYRPINTVDLPSLTLVKKDNTTTTDFIKDLDLVFKTILPKKKDPKSHPTAIQSIDSIKSDDSQNLYNTLYMTSRLAYDPFKFWETPPNSSIHDSSTIIPFYDTNTYFKKNQYRGIVRLVKNKLIIAFPGTRRPIKGIIDIFKDIKALGNDGGFSPSKELNFHSEFARDVMGFFDQIIEIIKNNSHNVDEIWFTGHSKGAGEALLTAFKFALYLNTEAKDNNILSKFLQENRIKVLTFSTPCVMNKAGRDLLEDMIGNHNIVSIHKKPDLVPTISKTTNNVPVGVRIKLPKENSTKNTTKKSLKNIFIKGFKYAKGFGSSHHLENFMNTQDIVSKLALYVDILYAPKPLNKKSPILEKIISKKPVNSSYTPESESIVDVLITLPNNSKEENISDNSDTESLTEVQSNPEKEILFSQPEPHNFF